MGDQSVTSNFLLSVSSVAGRHHFELRALSLLAAYASVPTQVLGAVATQCKVEEVSVLELAPGFWLERSRASSNRAMSNAAVVSVLRS